MAVYIGYQGVQIEEHFEGNIDLEVGEEKWLQGSRAVLLLGVLLSELGQASSQHHVPKRVHQHKPRL